MSQLTAEQLAQRIYDCGLMTMKELETTLQKAGGRGSASFNDFISTLLEQEQLTNWQISRVNDGHRRGYFYGNWKVLYLIGAGTFARVYRAAHRKTGDIKAVKVLRQRYGSDLDTREQFLREARMVMKLRHPNIVPIHEVEEDKGRIYMVMDFVEGQNLREYVKAHRRLPLMTALKIVRDVTAGLKYADENNITHRDIKLSNVLLSAKGQAKLVDFGLANVSGDDEDGKGGPRSIDYAGLERATGVRRNDKRSDIYFVGCMLYQLVSGAPPLLETRERIKRLSAQRYQDVRPVTHHVPDLPHRVAILIGRLMDLDVEKRIQSPAMALHETESVIHALESGDHSAFDEELTQRQIKEYAARQSRQEEGAGKTLLLIESNIKLQDSLREHFKKRGYRVLITSDPVRGLARFEDLDPADDLPADCVIFGCVGLGKEGLNAFAKFCELERSSQIPAIVVVPENLERFVEPKWLKHHRIQFSMPLRLKKLRRALRSLLRSTAVSDKTQSSQVVVDQGPIIVNEFKRDSDVEQVD
jgi:serine/threonine protein kinase